MKAATKTAYYSVSTPHVGTVSPIAVPCQGRVGNSSGLVVVAPPHVPPIAFSRRSDGGYVEQDWDGSENYEDDDFEGDEAAAAAENGQQEAQPGRFERLVHSWHTVGVGPKRPIPCRTSSPVTFTHRFTTCTATHTILLRCSQQQLYQHAGDGCNVSSTLRTAHSP